MDVSLSKLWEMVKDREACGHKESDTTYQLNNTTNYEIVKEKVVPILYNIFQKSKRKKLNFMGSVLP